jgi:hypothetical protein
MIADPVPLKNGAYSRTYGAPTKDIWPRFHMDTVEDPLASQRAGRPIFNDVERVEFNMPGNPYSKPVFAVTDEHRERWPQEYAAFKKGGEVAINGTPIDVLPFLKPSMVRELKALDIMTAEQLANLNDLGLQRIAMGGRRLKELAEAYLDDAKAVALVTQAQAENDKKDQRIAELELRLENAMTQMTNMFQQMQERMNAPNPLMTHVPASSDPMEAFRMHAQQAPAPVHSSFADLPAPPRRKRRTAAQMEEARMAATSGMDAGGNDGEAESIGTE